jgi:hypothetical protein
MGKRASGLGIMGVYRFEICDLQFSICSVSSASSEPWECDCKLKIANFKLQIVGQASR